MYIIITPKHQCKTRYRLGNLSVCIFSGCLNIYLSVTFMHSSSNTVIFDIVAPPFSFLTPKAMEKFQRSYSNRDVKYRRDIWPPIRNLESTRINRKFAEKTFDLERLATAKMTFRVNVTLISRSCIIWYRCCMYSSFKRYYRQLFYVTPIRQWCRYNFILLLDAFSVCHVIWVIPLLSK